MVEMNIWKFLGAVSIIGLLIFWRKKNAVWGGMSLGLIISVLIALFFKISNGSPFNWRIVLKGIIIGVLVGIILEIMGMIGNRIKRR